MLSRSMLIHEPSFGAAKAEHCSGFWALHCQLILSQELRRVRSKATEVALTGESSSDKVLMLLQHEFLARLTCPVSASLSHLLCSDGSLVMMSVANKL